MKVQIVITLEDGRIGLNGPLDDTVLCYGLLERAKDVVREIATRPKQLIQPAVAIPVLGSGGQ